MRNRSLAKSSRIHKQAGYPHLGYDTDLSITCPGTHVRRWPVVALIGGAVVLGVAAGVIIAKVTL